MIKDKKNYSIRENYTGMYGCDLFSAPFLELNILEPIIN